jgi:hypothetical protein
VNLLRAYAKLPVAFLNLYRRGNPRGTFKVLIACAMTGLLAMNVWSVLLLVSLLDHGWLGSRRKITGLEYGILCIGGLIAEFIFVDFVQRKAAEDRDFASRVVRASPTIAIRYIFTSGVVLVLLSVVTWIRG